MTQTFTPGTKVVHKARPGGTPRIVESTVWGRFGYLSLLPGKPLEYVVLAPFESVWFLGGRRAEVLASDLLAA